MKFYIALWFAKIINVIINIVDKSRGSNFSGEKAMKIDPQMVAHFKELTTQRFSLSQEPTENLLRRT